MNSNFLSSGQAASGSIRDAAQLAVKNAFSALHNGDNTAASDWARRAIKLSPDLEAPWLILAALASPQESVKYLQHVLTLNPNNQHAQRGMLWARRQLENQDQTAAPAVEPASLQTVPFQGTPVSQAALPRSLAKNMQMSASAAIVVFLSAALLFLVSAIILGNFVNLNAQVNASDPEVYPETTSVLPLYVAFQTELPLVDVTPTPTVQVSPTPAASPTPYILNTKEVIAASGSGSYIVQHGDTLLSISSALAINPADLLIANDLNDQSQLYAGQELLIPEASYYKPLDSPFAGEKRIEVDISDQLLYAYQGNALVFRFVTSTGSNNNTPTGTFTILDKDKNAYSDVWNFWMPYWMGFVWYDGLEDGIHALPISRAGEEIWSDSLGQAVSHGCIMLAYDDARRLFDWAEIGTTLDIHP